MFYLYEISTGDVKGSSPERAELEPHLEDGRAIIEHTAEVVGYYEDLQVVNGAVTCDPTNYLADQVRAQRNRLIAETDWWATSDRTMTAAETTYRQDLRDIPAQAGFPSNVNWPTKP